MELFTLKVVTKLSKIWVWDPGSRIPDPGVKKAPNPGSRIRIRNTGKFYPWTLRTVWNCMMSLSSSPWYCVRLTACINHDKCMSVMVCITVTVCITVLVFITVLSLFAFVFGIWIIYAWLVFLCFLFKIWFPPR